MNMVIPISLMVSEMSFSLILANESLNAMNRSLSSGMSRMINVSFFKRSTFSLSSSLEADLWDLLNCMRNIFKILTSLSSLWAPSKAMLLTFTSSTTLLVLGLVAVWIVCSKIIIRITFCSSMLLFFHPFVFRLRLNDF